MSHLSVMRLTKQFEGAAGPLDVLRGVDLGLDRGDMLAITGPSGSGKSTLLYIVGTLEAPSDGQVLIDGEDPFALPEAGLAAFRNRTIGFIFQDHHLLPQCNVLENTLLPLLAGDGVDAGAEQRARGLLDRVGLADRIDHRPASLSGGERQRVPVCRALITEPSILLADEPTGNLDQDTAESIGSLLLELGEDQQTVMICVTHSLELASRFPMRRELKNGMLVEPGPAESTISSGG